MTFWRPLRLAFIKSTDWTHGFQGEQPSKLIHFYKWWAPFYDFSVRLDPGYPRGLKQMVDAVVQPGDITLDVGSGTGLGTLLASSSAARVVAIDPSEAMCAKLCKKLQRRRINNVDVRHGYFPEALFAEESFDSVMTSFMLAHLDADARVAAIKAMFACLKSGGRLGLFAAQGEVAPTFQTRAELDPLLTAVGFVQSEVHDLADIYRVTTAVKP